MNINQFVFELLKQSYLNKAKLASLKRKWAKEFGTMIKSSDLNMAYQKLVISKIIARNIKLENLLQLKKIRSLSGIVPVAVLTKPYPCPGKCIYCPTQKNMPKSYLDDEPAVMRAKQANFDPYLQVKNRLEQLKNTGHSIDKIELIVMGGCFTSLPKNYQIDFISKCFEACNNEIQSSKFKVQNYNSLLKILLDEQGKNEKAKHRIIGLTLETRPDLITKDEIIFMRQLGCTRVEIGVQSIYDDVLTKVKRGHLVKATIKATKLLKDSGFKVCYHMMPNLPQSNLTKDFKMFKEIFTNQDFMPDMIKIYPCVVLTQAKLYKWYQQKKFTPYTNEQLINLLLKIKKIVPPWIRINRLGRDIPVKNIVGGNKISNIRQILQAKLKQEDFQCQCIRCREIRGSKIENCKLKIENLKASGGIEYFLQFVDKNNSLYALLRLRILAKQKHFILELQDTAIIRELHTYGKALEINKSESKASQHHGLGKKLLLKAEEIVKNLKIKKIAVISGIGAREYYRKLGYKLQGTYMVKALK